MTKQAILTSDLIARLDFSGHEEKSMADQYDEQTECFFSERGLTNVNCYIHRGDLAINGDFQNDQCLIVDGDLIIRGDYNDFGGGYLLCTGSVFAENVFAEQEFYSGPVHASGLVTAYGNDCCFDAKSIVARVFVLDDKSSFSEIDHSATNVYWSTEDEGHGLLQDELNPELLDWCNEDGDELTLEEARKKMEAGEGLITSFNSSWDLARDHKNNKAIKLFNTAYVLPDDPDADALSLAISQPDASASFLQEMLDKATNDEQYAHLEKYVAQAPCATPEMLAGLAEKNALSVAGHSSTPLATLELLAHHASEEVRAAVLYHCHCSAGIATQLANDPSPKVRRALAASPLAVPYIEQLLADPDAKVRLALAMHEALSLEQRRKLIADTNAHVRQRAIHSLPLTRGLIEEFANSGEADLRAWSAQHIHKLKPAKPVEPEKRPQKAQAKSTDTNNTNTHDAQHRLLLDPSSEVREAASRDLIGNYHLTAQYEQRLLDDEVDHIRWIVAHHSRNPEILSRLSTDPAEEVRSAVARNLATPAPVLIAMAKYLADTPSLDKGHSGASMSPRQRFTYLYLLANLLFPAAGFQFINTDLYPLNHATEVHPYMPLAYLLTRAEFNASDKNATLVQEAKAMLNQPEALLDFMARSKYSNFRQTAAINVGTPIEVLQYLVDGASSAINSGSSANIMNAQSLLEFVVKNPNLGNGTAASTALLDQLLAIDQVLGSKLIPKLLSNPHLPKEVALREAERHKNHTDTSSFRDVLWACHGIDLKDFQ